MKRKVTLLLFIFYYSINFSQEKIYLDENMNIMDSISFKKRCKISVLKCLVYKTDSMKINKVLKKYQFGKITKKQYHQLRKLFIQNIKKPIDPSSTILINYKDSLYGFDASQKYHDNHVKEHTSEHHLPFSFKSFDSGRKKWIKKQKKCVKKMKEKYNAETFFIYKYDLGSIKSYPDLNWMKDRSVFRNVFFKEIYNSNFLILKPNGDYFLSGGYFDNKIIKKLIQTEDWTNYKKDWDESLNTNSIKGKGLFKNSLFNKPHCF